MNLGTLFLKNILNKLDLWKKAVITQRNVWKNIFIACNHVNTKISDPANVKENYNSYLKRKNAKLLKRPKIITQRLKAIENSNIVDIKSVIVWTFKYFTWIIQDYNTSWKESPSTHCKRL